MVLEWLVLLGSQLPVTRGVQVEAVFGGVKEPAGHLSLSRRLDLRTGVSFEAAEIRWMEKLGNT